MCNEFLKEGVPIEKVYFSPFHPTAGLGAYKKNDFSRKPCPGMIYQAQKDINLNLQNSILIGDNITDIQAGITAGVGVNLFYGHRQTSDLKSLNYQVISNLREALPFFHSSKKLD